MSAVATLTTTAGPDVAVFKVEEFDVEFAEWILNNKDIPKGEREAVRRLLRDRVRGNKHETTYKLGKDIKHEDLGRFHAKGGIGLQCCWADTRAALAQKYYWDVDIRNAAPTLLQQYAEKRGWTCEKLKHFNENREEYIDELRQALQIERWEAKQRVYRVMFGGSCEGLTSFFVNELQPELRRLMENVFNENQKKYPVIAKKPNAVRSMMANVVQTEERTCLMALDTSLARQGRSLDVLIHDGGLVRKKDGEGKLPDEVLRKCEKDILEMTGYKVSLAVKPLNTTFVMECQDNDYVPANVLIDDTYAATHFANLLEGKIVLDSGDVWIFDEHTGIWTCNETYINRKMAQDFRDKLVFKQMRDGKVVTYNYSGDVAHQDRLRRALPAVLPDRTGYFADRIESSVSKLLFTDGIYDFVTHTFTPGFDPNIVFYGSVPRPFPKERNEEAMEFVRKTFFRDPFKNEAVGDALLHYIARAIAGHFEAKKTMVCYGPENSTKGTLCKHLDTTFGEGLMGTFQGDSLLMRNSDVEATKSLSWIKKFCDKRIAYSSEITIDPRRPVNGNLLKSLSGGGDKITLRTNHKDEEKVVNKAITFIFVNDMPNISSADNSVRDRLVTIPYSYSFVDEPKFAYQKKRNHQVTSILKQDMYRDAMVWLVLDAIKMWNGEPYTLPDECKALKDDLAPMLNVEEVLSEQYELTGNLEDWVSTEELVAYLRSRKIEGSDRKLGDKLTQIGLDTSVRRDGRKTVRARVGIRKLDA